MLDLDKPITTRRAYETSAAAIKENTDECGILSVVQAIEFKDVYEDEL